MRKALVILALVVNMGCMGKKVVVKEEVAAPFPSHDSKIAASVISVEIHDLRTDVDKTGLAIPFSPYPGQNDARSPQLGKDLAAKFEKKINLIKGQGDPKVIFEISVLKAKMGWISGTARKKIFAEVELEIAARDGASEELLLMGIGTTVRRKPVVTLEVAQINSLYDFCLDDALRKFLDHAENVKVLNSNLERLAQASAVGADEGESEEADPPKASDENAATDKAAPDSSPPTEAVDKQQAEPEARKEDEPKNPEPAPEASEGDSQ